MASATQNLIVLGGAGLIGANIWFGGGPNLSNIVPFYTGQDTSAATEAHRELVMVIFGFIGVWVLSIFAGVSQGASDAAVTFVGGLWLLWLIERAHKHGTTGVFSHTASGTTGVSTSGTNTSTTASQPPGSVLPHGFNK